MSIQEAEAQIRKIDEEIRQLEQKDTPDVDFETIKDETYRLGHPIYVRVRGGQSGLTVALDHALFIDGYTDYASGSYIGCIFLGDPNKTSYSVVYFSEDGEYPYTLNDITGYVDAYIKLY